MEFRIKKAKLSNFYIIQSSKNHDEHVKNLPQTKLQVEKQVSIHTESRDNGYLKPDKINLPKLFYERKEVQGFFITGRTERETGT